MPMKRNTKEKYDRLQVPFLVVEKGISSPVRSIRTKLCAGSKVEHIFPGVKISGNIILIMTATLCWQIDFTLS